jgi:outer membrane protein assembly factor BamB
MKTQTNRIISIIAIVLMSTGAIAVTLPAGNAHTPSWNIPTYAYVTASPNTVGVGEYTVFVMWLDKYPTTAGGLGGDLWRGFKLDITKPDGTKLQLGPFTSSQIGSIWTVYTPDQTGDYTIVFSWPGQTLTNGTGQPNTAGLAYVGDYFMPSSSAPITLRVTQNKVPQWQEPPITTDYWSRPLNSANRAWSNLASNWLKGSWLVGNFQTAGKAPNSAHILWANPIISGGIPDAQWPGNSYDTDDYESPWTAPIIMNGVIYYNTGIYPKYGYYAIDLRSGEQIWYRNGTENMPKIPLIMQRYNGIGGAGVYSGETYPSLSFGQLYHYYSLNGAGVLSYLWITYGNSWYMLDSNTGNWILTLTNVPGGTAVVDQDGSLLRYSYSATTGQFLCWNSSQSIPPPSPTGTGQQQWKPMTGATIDAVNDTTWTQWGVISTQFTADDIRPRSGYTMNVTGPKGLPGLSAVLQDENRVPRMMIFSDMRNSASFGSSDTYFRIAVVRIDYAVAPYSPQPDKTFTQNNNLGYGVTLLYNKTINKPLGGNLTFSLGSTSFIDGVFTVESKETMQKWGYSLTTGEQIWGPTNPQAAFDMYGMTGNVAYGKIFSCGYAGILYCYDVKTGKLLWNYSAPGIGSESPYGDYPLSISAIADGKVYLHSTEHSPTIPLWRGSYLRCIDVSTGKELWKLLDFNMGLALADGYIVTGNKYDNRMYTIGKGPSATTVTAPETAVPLGTGVVIRGTVTDQSPGAKGTPAIADSDQQAWMEYMYEQQAKPTNIKGVQVKLTALDPNGNVQDIGTVTSDMGGIFHKMWTPPVQGEYTIIATFSGTESYGSSYAETSIGVGPAPSAAPVVTSTPSQTIAPSPTSIQSASPSSTNAPNPTSGTPATTYVAIGTAVIIIVAVAATLVLRRRR